MSWIRDINERIAVAATGIFGSMWTTYVFFTYGFIPIIFPATMTALLYWSNTVQLWSLPLIAVGTAVLGRAAVQQARETHDAVMEVLRMIREALALLREERQLLREERDFLQQEREQRPPAAAPTTEEVT